MCYPLVFLQNAWSRRWSGRHWPRAKWLKALYRSHTGCRLVDMLDDLSTCWNLTPKVCSTPEEIPEPDISYIKTIINQQAPRLVVACGRVAERVIPELWPGPLLVVPHPTFRMLTKKLYIQAGEMITQGFSKRAALRQRREGPELVML